MKSLLCLFTLLVGAARLLPAQTPPAPVRPLPAPLAPWADWATWDDAHRHCPTPSTDPAKHLCFWPSRAGLQVDKTGGRFDVAVTVFHETWVPLPGGRDLWPGEVRVNGTPVAVLERETGPGVRLAAGTHRIEGAYRWSEIPQRIAVPPAIGILVLLIDGRPVEGPAWDADGYLWLKRDGASSATDKDFLAVKVHSALEDGIPLWLRTEVELTVAGKSREEELGTILPEGWKLAAVQSPIPVAIDDTGRMKAQVRAGKWTVKADAFRFDNPKEVRYAPTARPAAAEQLVAFRARPDFRVVEIIGAPAIDVSQTTFPEKWRELPVYRWDPTQPFQIEERMRGMGDRKVAGLSFAREWWLDEDGAAFTFRDTISGQMQQVWRLDATPGLDLGSVRSGGVGQLITRHPQTASPGVEIRDRNLNLEATGRMARAAELPATGWTADAESVQVKLNLPPGWRLFALFGADWVQGDWLTAWTLLDLFLLLIFTLAVFRLWGFFPALIAFLAFGLAYHEPGAPRYIWLLLLVPLALGRVLPAAAAVGAGGSGMRLLMAGKGIALIAFVGIAAPFVASQVQQALYPQLENVGPGRFGGRSARNAAPLEVARSAVNAVVSSDYESESGGSLKKQARQKENLQYDTKARIQTGPGVPEWQWRTVSFGWNGPVRASQEVRPILIPLAVERGLTIARVVLLLALAALLLKSRRRVTTVPPAIPPVAAPVAALLLASLLFPATAHAQMPDGATLEQLRARLLEKSDAYPHAADLPSVALTLRDRRITIDAEVHAALRTAVPLPGRLPAWSPVSVFLDDLPEVALRRDDGYLWVVVPPGVHRVRVEGLLATVTEWEWTFLLQPRRVTIDAPGWNVTGVRPDGVPEAQVFFALQQKAAAGQASYDRQDLQTLAAIDRHLELGLIWQVRTVVSRLSPPGKAIALRVPLLPGENVFSAHAVVKDGFIEVRIGAQEPSASWESGLAVAAQIALATRADDGWVERWHLVASPVWNVTLAGLAPTFEPSQAELVPVWQPWPGERVTLTIGRPEAVAGATVTVSRGTHEMTLGRRQRVSQLDLNVQCSLGEDFLIELPAEAEITKLEHAGQAIPVRKDGAKLIVPLRPGEQTIAVGWKTNVALEARTRGEEVRLPVESANMASVITTPDDRWVLWTDGPRRGPAVRFWGILVCSLLAALALGRIALSPLRTIEWMLLGIGLTQVPLPAALVVIGWLFLLAWRGRDAAQRLGAASYHLLQIAILALTVAALGILIVAVGQGLLGNPEMFISGNGSSRTILRWYQARSEALLPRPGCWSISIWWFRFFMLLWALWLALALLRWLRLGWQHFTAGGILRRSAPTPAKSAAAPPPLPAQP